MDPQAQQTQQISQTPQTQQISQTPQIQPNGVEDIKKMEGAAKAVRVFGMILLVCGILQLCYSAFQCCMAMMGSSTPGLKGGALIAALVIIAPAIIMGILYTVFGTKIVKHRAKPTTVMAAAIIGIIISVIYIIISNAKYMLPYFVATSILGFLNWLSIPIIIGAIVTLVKMPQYKAWRSSREA